MRTTNHCSIGLVFLLVVSAGIAQTQRNSRVIHFLPAESQSNIVIHVDGINTGKPGPTPLQFTNLLSNTNLFSPEEKQMLEQIAAKYRAVTTNSGPEGTVLIGMTNTPRGVVSFFQHTNSGSREEILFGGMKTASFRTAANDGYDIDLAKGEALTLNFQEIKRGEVDGLFVTLYEGKCNSLMRFVEGKAIGTWLIWGRWGDEDLLLLHAEFKEPYDFFKHTPRYRRQSPGKL